MMRKFLFVLIQVALCQWFFVPSAIAEDSGLAQPESQPVAVAVDIEANKNSVPLASDTYQLKKENSPGTIGGTTDVGDVVFALIVVLGLIVFAAWATKRLNLNGMAMGQTLKLQSVLSLGTKEKIVVVEVEGEKLLLGVTPQNVNLLCRLENNNENDAEEIQSNSASSNNGAGSFAQQIKKALAQGKLGEDTKAS